MTTPRCDSCIYFTRQDGYGGGNCRRYPAQGAPYHQRQRRVGLYQRAPIR